MSTIRVNCIDQALAFENTPLITSGGLDFATFTFCSKWAGYTRTAVFWRNEADAYHVLLDGTDTCQIPPEVTGDEGTIFFGVFGVNSAGKQRTSQVLTYRIEKGTITVGTAPSDPTPDIYTQLIAMEREFEEHITELVVNGMVPDGTMTTAKMADESVTTEKLAPGSVTANKLADWSATTEKLADGSVTTDKIAAGSVTKDKLADGSVTFKKLTDAAVAGVLAHGVHVFAGSYVGTGEAGTDHAITLTVPFEPKLLVIQPENTLKFEIAIAVRGVTGMGREIGEGLSTNQMHYTWGEKSVSMYVGDEASNDSQAAKQFNVKDSVYRYLIIG